MATLYRPPRTIQWHGTSRGQARLTPTAGFLLTTIVLLIGACSARSQPDEEPGDTEHEEPPVAEWRDFTAEQRSAFLELLAGLRPAEGVDGEVASQWRAAFAARLPPETDWTVSLGVAPAAAVREAGYRPFLLWPGAGSELTVTQACLLANDCLSCLDAVGDGQAEPAVPEGDFRGICTTLSTAYSLVYSLGLRTEFGSDDGVPGTMVERNGRKYWRKGFLETIRRDQRHEPGQGTHRLDIARAYERYGCRCDRPISIEDAGGADAWKTALRTRLASPEPVDCHFLIDVKNGRGHNMHIDAMDERGALLVTETEVQGSGSGDDVPVRGGHQKWTVGSQGEVTCRSSPRKANVIFWLRQTITGAHFLCCRCPPSQ